MSFRAHHHRAPRVILYAVSSLLAMYTCVSRITDNKHHPTDVLAGIAIGALFAVVFVSVLSVGIPTLYKGDINRLD